MTHDQPSHAAVVAATADAERTMEPQRVPVNVYETSGALVIVAPMPAVTPNDVTIELRAGQLRFWRDCVSAGPRQYLIHEWDYGGYEREIDVPDGYGSGVEASVVNGQLVVRVLSGQPVAPITVKPTGA